MTGMTLIYLVNTHPARPRAVIVTTPRLAAVLERRGMRRATPKEFRAESKRVGEWLKARKR